MNPRREPKFASNREARRDKQSLTDRSLPVKRGVVVPRRAALRIHPAGKGHETPTLTAKRCRCALGGLGIADAHAPTAVLPAGARRVAGLALRGGWRAVLRLLTRGKGNRASARR